MIFEVIITGGYGRFAWGASCVLIKLLQISHKYGICSLEMENKLEIQFWCCPRVGNLFSVFQPHCGAFAAFRKQDDKYSTNAQGGGGEEWARLEMTEPLIENDNNNNYMIIIQ